MRTIIANSIIFVCRGTTSTWHKAPIRQHGNLETLGSNPQGHRHGMQATPLSNLCAQFRCTACCWLHALSLLLLLLAGVFVFVPAGSVQARTWPPQPFVTSNIDRPDLYAFRFDPSYPYLPCIYCWFSSQGLLRKN